MHERYPDLPEADAYLVRSTHEIFHAVNSAKTYPAREQEYLTLAAVVGCDALKTFLSKWEDQQFLQSLEGIHQRQMDTEYLQVFNDLDQLDDFLVEDQRLMEEVGLDTTVADKLFRRARLLITDIQRWKTIDPPAKLHQTVSTLKEATCNVAREMRQEQQRQVQEQQRQAQEQQRQAQEREDRRRRRRSLSRVAYAVGGAAVIGANVAADAGLLGLALPPTATALSSNVGQTLIGGALPLG